MISPTKDFASYAQEIIFGDNVKLRAKNQRLKENTIKSGQKILELMEENANLSEKILELTEENADLSEKNIDHNQLKTEYNKLRDATNNILNANKSLEQLFNQSQSWSLQKLPLINDKIKKIMKNHEYEKLLSYKIFDVRYLFKNIFSAIWGIKTEIMKHIIDHGLDLNVEVELDEFSSTRLIHLFCINSTDELIKYLIDKGVELECPNKEGHYPLHLICMHSTFKMAKYIISKGVNTKSNPKINLIEIINNSVFTYNEKKELIALIE